MRHVRINGEEHAIPKDRAWVMRTQECLNYPRYMQVTTEYRFQAEPCNYVEIREMRQDIGVAAALEDAKLVADEWVDQPREPLAKYLLVEPNGPNQDHLHYGGAGMDYDFAAHEKRFLAAMSNTKTGRTSSKKKTSMPSRAAMADPVKEAYNKYTSQPYDAPLPSFEEELLIDRTEPSSFKAYYPPDHPERYKQEEEDMHDGPRFSAGTRVLFRHPRLENTDYGTVVGRVPEMRGKCKPGQYLIAADTPSHYSTSHTKYTGDDHGIVVDVKKSGMSEAPGGEWHAVPEHIGVFVTQGFVQDDVKFHSNSTGRIMCDVHEGMVDVSWNFPNDNFHNTEDANGALRQNVWTVPAAKLNMCLLDTHTKEVVVIWPAAAPGQRKKRKEGDLCIVKGRSVSMMDSEDREVVLQSGTVVELLTHNGDRYKTWGCRVIGECSDKLLNKTVNIRVDYLREHPSPDSFYRPGTQVEIVAEIDFRKKPLQGMKGRVILSTDTEGDVGIEFAEDIGAGSLDGIGREGHCIYIEASLVKSSE